VGLCLFDSWDTWKWYLLVVSIFQCFNTKGGNGTKKAGVVESGFNPPAQNTRARAAGDEQLMSAI